MTRYRTGRLGVLRSIRTRMLSNRTWEYQASLFRIEFDCPMLSPFLVESFISAKVNPASVHSGRYTSIKQPCRSFSRRISETPFVLITSLHPFTPAYHRARTIESFVMAMELTISMHDNAIKHPTTARTSLEERVGGSHRRTRILEYDVGFAQDSSFHNVEECGVSRQS